MKKCYHCKRTGFQAEKFIGIPKLPLKSLCMGCAVEIYLILRKIIEKKSAITEKLNDPS